MPSVAAIKRPATAAAICPSSAPASSSPAASELSPSNPQLGDAARVEAGRLSLAHAEQQRHRLRLQPARRERDRLGRGRIQPVRVVEHGEERLALGRRGEQLKCAGVGEEGIHLSRFDQRQRSAQRLSGCLWDLVEPVEHRAKQLVQTREGELGL